MYIYQNLNPHDEKIDDCVIRAIALVTNKSWDEIYWDLAVRAAIVKDLPNANQVWIPYLYEIGYKRYMVPDICPVCYTVRQFVNDHRHGVYILWDGKHVVAAVDGNYIDNYDSGGNIVSSYFCKEEET